MGSVPFIVEECVPMEDGEMENQDAFFDTSLMVRP